MRFKDHRELHARVVECQAAARALGLEAPQMELRRPEDIATTFDALGGGAG